MQYLLTQEEYDSLRGVDTQKANRYAQYVTQHHHKQRSLWLEALMKLGQRSEGGMLLSRKNLDDANRILTDPLSMDKWEAENIARRIAIG